MDIPTIKHDAAQALRNASYHPKKLALLHAGAALAATLVLTLINYLLGRGIDNTGGLAGIGTRTVLESANSLLSLAVSFALPFWEMGFLYAAMGMARQEPVGPATLLQGFRRFGPVLRLHLLQLMLYMGIAVACTYAATFLFFFSPLSAGMMEALQTILESGTSAEELMASDALYSQLLPTMIPVYVLMAILFLVVALPVFYRFRMAGYVLLDAQKPRARAALGISGQLMRGNRWELAKLDLRFWWYYGAQLVITVVAYADLLFSALGIHLPVSSDAAMFICFILQMLLQLLLAYTSGSYVQTTYAMCYCKLSKSVSPSAP